jgi:hypothetical protein
LLDDAAMEKKPDHSNLKTIEDLNEQITYMANSTTSTDLIAILKENSVGTHGTKFEKVKRLLVFVLGE